MNKNKRIKELEEALKESCEMADWWLPREEELWKDPEYIGSRVLFSKQKLKTLHLKNDRFREVLKNG